MNMNKEMFKRLLDYRTAMAVVTNLLHKGIITEEEYAKIDTIMTKKYGVNSSTIFF